MTTNLSTVGVRDHTPRVPTELGPLSASGTPVRDLARGKVSEVGAVAHPVDVDLARRNVRAAISELNSQLKQAGRNVSFDLDRETGRIVVTVRNSLTGEVIRQIPDEAILKAAHSISELKGLIHDSMA